MTFTEDGSQEIATDAGVEYVAWAQGDFGGGAIAIQSSDNGTDWVSLRDDAGAIAISASGGIAVVAPTSKLRLTLTGATAPGIRTAVVPIRRSA